VIDPVLHWLAAEARALGHRVLEQRIASHVASHAGLDGDA
jgi:hypothetical protein